MAIAKVGQAKASNGTGNPVASISITYTSTTGNLLLVAVRNGDATGATITSISDGTNLFFPCGWIGIADTGQVSLQFFYAYNITGTAGPIVVSFAPSVAWVWGYVVEFSGLATISPKDVFDQRARPNQGANFTFSTDTITTTQANEVLLIAISQVGLNTYTASGAYTLLDGNIGGFGGVAYKIVASTESAVQSIVSSDASAGVVGVITVADTAILSTSNYQSHVHAGSRRHRLGGMNM